MKGRGREEKRGHVVDREEGGGGDGDGGAGWRGGGVDADVDVGAAPYGGVEGVG